MCNGRCFNVDMFRCHWLRYDVADWPLVVCRVIGYDETGAPKHLTKQDVEAGMTASSQLFAACLGDTRNMTDLVTGARSPPLAPGMISVMIDLRLAAVPAFDLITDVVGLIKHCKRYSKRCVSSVAVVVDPSYLCFVKTVAAMAGGVRAQVFEGEAQAFAALAADSDGDDA